MRKKSMSHQFASDNYAGICPEVMHAMELANAGHVAAYGDDTWTNKASECFRELFATDCEVFFVFNGTAGNGLALATLCRSYHGVVCHELAHIATDECGAPGFFGGGLQLLVSSGPEGKLTVAGVEELIVRRQDLHAPKVRALSITQATEAGTVYSLDELHEFGEIARNHNLLVHMDGARFANAVAASGCSAREMTEACGTDVLCFGGTKNGMAIGDAIIFFNQPLAEDFAWRCKQAGQLASKMRYITAPWVALLTDDLWLKNAARANARAAHLERRLQSVPGVDFVYKRQANALYVRLSHETQDLLKERGWQFYHFVESGGARLMCSWDTQEVDVERFADDVEAAMQGAAEK